MTESGSTAKTAPTSPLKPVVTIASPDPVDGALISPAAVSHGGSAVHGSGVVKEEV